MCISSYQYMYLTYMIAANACNTEKLRFNGGYYCTGVGDSYSCTLNCPPGVEFEFPPAATYTCTYDKGVFEPQPIPQCKVDNNIKIISLGTTQHIGTSYNTYVSNHSWSIQDVYNSKTKYSQENWQHSVHTSNTSSYPVNNNNDDNNNN